MLYFPDFLYSLYTVSHYNNLLQENENIRFLSGKKVFQIFVLFQAEKDELLFHHNLLKNVSII